MVSKELKVEIRFIGGMWRRLDGDKIKSFSTFQDAVDNNISWEDQSPQTTTDDILEQMQGTTPVKKKKREASR